MKSWKLKRTAQCQKCPWRVDANPRDIPSGYCEAKHKGLADTIAGQSVEEQLQAFGNPIHAMACHETQDAHCVGWLVNQLGPGNNIALRLHMYSCENSRSIRLRGAQHESFEDTLPKD